MGRGSREDVRQGKHHVQKAGITLEGFEEAVGFPGGSDSKGAACSAGHLVSIPGFGKIPWRREWLPTSIFLPGEFYGQRSLMGYNPCGLKESDTT